MGLPAPIGVLVPTALVAEHFLQEANALIEATAPLACRIGSPTLLLIETPRDSHRTTRCVGLEDKRHIRIMWIRASICNQFPILPSVKHAGDAGITFAEHIHNHKRVARRLEGYLNKIECQDAPKIPQSKRQF